MCYVHAGALQRSQNSATVSQSILLQAVFPKYAVLREPSGLHEERRFSEVVGQADQLK